MTLQKIIENNIDELFELHLEILKGFLKKKSFEEIEAELIDQMNALDYKNLISNRLLTFNDGILIGAYPISPIPSEYKVIVEGIGEGYAMCAIDALGVAYTFMAKTIIETKDFGMGKPITLNIDPFEETQEPQRAYVTYLKQERKSVRSSALDVCPSVNFYSSIADIPDDMEVINFEDALKSARLQFNQDALKKCMVGGNRDDSISLETSLSEDNCCNSNSC